MPEYSFAECLQNSQKVNWTLEEVLSDHSFDLGLPWLPSALSGAGPLQCLTPDEKRKMTQIEMGAYAHLFGYVEEFITPKVRELAQEAEGKRPDAFAALSNFATEEEKHMALFRRVREMVNQTLKMDLMLLARERETADYVLGKPTGAVLLLTACIEWLTQRHYLEAFQDDETLDPFTKHVFKCHWLEEAQHAKMDNMEVGRVFGEMNDAEKEDAIDELIDLMGTLDVLLQKQSRYDVENLETLLRRTFTPSEREEIFACVLRAKRYTFLFSGVTHERFAELLAQVTTPAQQERLHTALRPLLAPSPNEASVSTPPTVARSEEVSV